MNATINIPDEPDVWAIVEIMGHSRFAGRISQTTQFGLPMLRIEVPETKTAQAFEKHFGAAAVFGLTPCTEAVARRAAESFAERPTTLIDLSMRLPAPSTDDGDDDDVED